jgi:hypothetical protein
MTPRLYVLAIGCCAALACDTGIAIAPLASADKLVLTVLQVRSLDSSAQAMAQANPANGNLKSLVDSTLLVLTAGVEAKRLDVSTNLTTAPLYFVGVHRAYSRPTGSFSTWTLVGIDDPSHLANLVEVGGFAQSPGVAAPTTVGGTIGDGTGIVNGTLLQVGTAGAVTEWHANTGMASFTSDSPGAACPGFVPQPKVTCALETMHVQFTMTAPGSGGTSRQASVASIVDVPTMRLTVTP